MLGIMLHNYCHWLRFAVKENEFRFSEINNDRLLDVLAHPDWNLPIHLLSYFGHYGVPVFLFLSGFGLVMKYEASPSLRRESLPQPPPKGGGDWSTKSPLFLVGGSFLKLFRMMIIGFVLFVVVDNLTPGPHRYALLDVVTQLLMVNNLMPTPDKVIWPGPFWFFGLMMQLYIIYHLLFSRLRNWRVVVAMIVICWLVQMPFLGSGDGEMLNYLRYNFISGMLPFGIGILVGRISPHIRIEKVQAWHWILLLVGGCLLTVACCLVSAHTWLWSAVGVVLTAIAFIKLMPQRVIGWLAWTGGISAAMFVTHATLRKIFIPISHRGDVYTGLLLYVVATFVVSWILMGRIKNERMKKDEADKHTRFEPLQK